MFESVWIGRYVAGNRFLHKMDPRCKLAMTGAFGFLVAVNGSVGMTALLAAAAGLAAFASRIPPFAIWRSLKAVLWLASAASLVQLFGHSGGKELVSVYTVTIDEEGLRQAVLMLGRMSLLVISVSSLTLTTSAADLAYGLAALLRPLRMGRARTERYAFSVILSVRFLPVFLQEIDRIATAYKARQGSFGRSGLTAVIRQTGSLFILAFAHAYRRAEGLALGLEARGYRTDAERVRRITYRCGWRDAVGLIAVAVLSVAVMAVKCF